MDTLHALAAHVTHTYRPISKPVCPTSLKSSEVYFVAAVLRECEPEPQVAEHISKISTKAKQCQFAKKKSNLHKCRLVI